jgi:hypothetical protein
MATVAGIVIPGTDIITTTGVFTIAPRTIRATTTANTTAAIIATIIGKTMIDRRAP